jgi:type III secretory pathway component EscV
VEGELPELQVISFAELLPEIQLQPLARVEG